jgi:signal transduction histidine kinase
MVVKAAGKGANTSKRFDGASRAESAPGADCGDGTAQKHLQEELRAAVLQERGRMARDIHDTVAQAFTGIIVQLEAAEDALQRGDATQSGVHLQQVGKLAREGLAEARRSVRALRPQVLEDQSLRAALERLIQEVTPGSRLRAALTCIGQARELAPEVEEGLLRIGQEALTNTLKHAEAKDFCARLVFEDGEVRLEVCDNGRGFDPSAAGGGFGLLGMKERVARLRGRLSIESSLGHGTRILVTLPDGAPPKAPPA